MNRQKRTDKQLLSSDDELVSSAELTPYKRKFLKRVSRRKTGNAKNNKETRGVKIHLRVTD